MLTIIREIQIKEWLVGLMLLFYIGGFAYFWGAMTNDAYLVFAIGFLVTHFFGNTIIRNIILKRQYGYYFNNRYTRLFLDFSVNIVSASFAIKIIRGFSQNNLDEFLAGPIVYGLIFGSLYMLYFIFSLKKMDDRERNND